MANEHINCPKCGASINYNSAYCSYCGAMIPEMKKIIQGKAELELEKEKNAEFLKTLHRTENIRNRKVKFGLIMAIIGTVLIFLMMLFATGRL